MKVLLFLFFVNISIFPTVANAWFMRLSDGKCIDQANKVTPEGLLIKNDVYSCKKVKQSGKLISFDCKSDTPGLTGKVDLYPEKKDCEKNDSAMTKAQYVEVKKKWSKNYNSKLWSYTYDNCGSRQHDCKLSTKKSKDIAQAFNVEMKKEGYGCGSTFDVIEGSDRPSDELKMSIICFRRSDFCSASIFWFEDKSECEQAILNRGKFNE